MDIVAEREGIEEKIPDISKFDPNADEMPPKMKSHWERANYAAMMENMDTSIGMVLDKLKGLGLHKNTFVIFSSDNGGGASNKPLQGGKAKMWEGGIRVPGIARWPGKIPAGKENQTPIIGSDLFSTILGIMDIPLPDDRTIDGVNIMPLFSGLPITRKIPLYWRNHLARTEIHVALRDGDWKILGNAQLDTFELYNIAKDWQEKEEVSTKFPDKLKSMKKTLLSVHRQVEEEGPQDWWKNEPVGKPKKKKKKAN